MSGNPELEILSCNFNKLESINLYKNSKLLQLDVGDNLLQEIDLSRNSKLYSLNIGANLQHYNPLINNDIASAFSIGLIALTSRIVTSLRAIYSFLSINLCNYYIKKLRNEQSN